MLLAMLLSLLIGLSLGLLGGGGSILTVPILVYAVGVEPKAAIATSLLVVGVTSLVAMLQHARAGNVDLRTGLVFGAAGMVGAYGGGLLARFFSGTVLLLIFAALMVATAVAMLRGRREPDERTHERLPLVRVLLDGFVVGLVTGLVGAGGGFLVVPALVLLGGLPMHRAVGTSLLVITLKSFAGLAGHVTHVDVDLSLAAVVTAAAVAGSVLGAALAPRVPARRLRRTFAWFVLGMAAYLVLQQIRGL